MIEYPHIKRHVVFLKVKVVDDFKSSIVEGGVHLNLIYIGGSCWYYITLSKILEKIFFSL